MRNVGEEFSSNRETHFYLDALVTELHFSMFNALIDGTDRIITWPAKDGSAVYAAINLDPLDDYDRDPRPINAYRAVGRDWQITRLVYDSVTDTSDAKAFVTYFGRSGLELHILEYRGMPMNPNNTLAKEQWSSAAEKSKNLQFEVGMNIPDDVDYAEFENAIYDLKTYNKRHISDRSAFEEAAHLDRMATGME